MRSPDPRNPHDWPGGRVPNPFDGMTMDEFCKQIDARVSKLLDANVPAVLKRLDAHKRTARETYFKQHLDTLKRLATVTKSLGDSVTDPEVIRQKRELRAEYIKLYSESPDKEDHYEADLLRAFDRVDERCSAIEKRLDGALFFKGVYAEGTEYGPGSLVQHAGTAWVSTVEKATTKPGTSGEWRLLVKTAKVTHDD